MREGKRERAKKGEGEHRRREGGSRMGTGTEMRRKGRSVTALRASQSSWDLAPVLRASYNAGVQLCVSLSGGVSPIHLAAAFKHSLVPLSSPELAALPLPGHTPH